MWPRFHGLASCGRESCETYFVSPFRSEIEDRARANSMSAATASVWDPVDRWEWPAAPCVVEQARPAGAYVDIAAGLAALTATWMRFATAAGCDTATEWEASISSIVRAPARCAMKRWASG